ncbi:MAG: ATP:cob(I)alamin adenosyltransferase, partial [Planctomycetota bacterium]
CRKAERRTVEFSRSSGEGQQAIIFLNRLSDLIFLQARAANQADGIADIPWKPNE